MADVSINDFTNGTIGSAEGQYFWQGTGVFDVIMKAVNANIKIEFDNGRINSSDYATVYLGALQSVIGQSMEFIIREKQVEAEIALLTQQKLTETQQTAKSAYEVTNILPATLLSIQKQTDVTEREMSEKELTGAKQRNLLEIEAILKDKETTKAGLDDAIEMTKKARIAGNGSVIYSKMYV